MLSCVIAEDETLLSEALVELLKEVWPDLKVAAVCDDGGSAIEAIIEHQPQIAFLDIRMPGVTGLEVASAIMESSPQTQIVFVTAYHQHAIDAFEKGAIDYLLKPVTKERLTQTMQRLQQRAMINQPKQEALAEILKQLGAQWAPVPKEPLVWITASTGKDTHLIMVDDVLYFQADNKYTTVVTVDAEALLRKPIRDLLGLLDATYFKQIHRSTIVNLRAIASITRDDTGRGSVKLKSRAETLSVSQPFMILFRHM